MLQQTCKQEVSTQLYICSICPCLVMTGDRSSVPPPTDKSIPLLTSVHKVWKRWPLLQMQTPMQGNRDYQESGKSDVSKGIEQASCIWPQEMVQEWLNKELKRIILQMPRELQENKDKPSNDIRKTIWE